MASQGTDLSAVRRYRAAFVRFFAVSFPQQAEGLAQPLSFHMVDRHSCYDSASDNDQEKRDKERRIDDESTEANDGSAVAPPIADPPLQQEKRKEDGTHQVESMVVDELRNPDINARELRQQSASMVADVLQRGNALQQGEFPKENRRRNQQDSLEIRCPPGFDVRVRLSCVHRSVNVMI